MAAPQMLNMGMGALGVMFLQGMGALGVMPFQVSSPIPVFRH